MAEDRGGLNYGIRIRDEFSAPLEAFQQEIAAAKAAFADFENERRRSDRRRRGNSPEQERLRALQQLAREQQRREREAQRINRAAQRDRAAEDRRQVRALQEAARRRERNAREAQRLEQARRSDESRAAREAERAEVDSLRRRRRERQRLSRQLRRDPRIEAERQLRRVEINRLQTLERIRNIQSRSRGFGGLANIGRDIQEVNRLREGLRGASRQGNNLFFTLRRLIGALAFFELLRRGTEAFNDLVGAGLRFNDTIESSVLGIAGLVTALSDVRDPFGESVNQATELDLALGIAREQVAALRQDSLRTVATFEELLDTFQVAVGPGLAAGLNLDEIRSLTVDISQAAAALSVPQNQLAEEVRSLLSGTIQARTTRIATALGITNADVRALRETGELFDFLDERFSAFSESAQRQARQTLTGIRTLIRGAVGELLGQAAQPLFEELLESGNRLFDEVITIQNAAGEIRPNPQAVRAFETLFEVLRGGVVTIREFVQGIGFDGLQRGVEGFALALSTSFEFFLGLARGASTVFGTILGIVFQVRDALGLSNQQLGQVVGALGTALVVLSAIGPIIATLVGGFASILTIATRVSDVVRLLPNGLLRVLGIVGALIGVFNLLFRSAAGRDISLGETLIIALEAVQQAAETTAVSLELFFKTTVNSIAQAFTDPFGFLTDRLSDLVGLLSGALALIPGVSTEARAEVERIASALDKLGNDDADSLIFSEEELSVTRAKFKEIEDRFQKLADARANAANGLAPDGSGLADDDLGLDKVQAEVENFAAFLDGAFGPQVSNARRPLERMGEELVKLSDNLRQTRQEFGQGFEVGGAAGRVDAVFRRDELANLERTRELQLEIESGTRQIASAAEEANIPASRLVEIYNAQSSAVQDRDAAVEALNLTEQEGLVNSLIRDQILLRDGLNAANQDALQLAVARAAVVAQQQLPALREEIRLASAQAIFSLQAAEAIRENRGARALAVIQAQRAVVLAREEQQLARDRALAELDALRARLRAAKIAGSDAEVATISDLISGLETRLELEKQITDEKQAQLQEDLRIAQLQADGTVFQGLQEGLIQFRKQFGSAFQAGIDIARNAITALSQFASQAIVDSFDPTKDQADIEQAFGRVLQSIAQQILQTIIQLAIARTLLGVPAPVAGGGGTVPSIPTIGFAAGGEARAPIARHMRRPKGFHRGGRPAGMNPLDIVPAYLRPGEFVVRREVTRQPGVMDALTALNGGDYGVAANASAAVASPSTGMIAGGTVSDIGAQGAGVGQDGGILPVLVADERQFDQLQRGGRAARGRAIREDASAIRREINRIS